MIMAKFKYGKYEGEKTCEKYIEMASQGKAEVVIAAELNISERTLYDWFEKYEELRLAREIGKSKSQAYYHEYFREKGNGTKYKNGDFKAMSFLASVKHGWQQRTGLDVNTEDATLKISFVSPDADK